MSACPGARFVASRSENFTKPWCHLLGEFELHVGLSKHRTTGKVPLELATGYQWAFLDRKLQRGEVIMHESFKVGDVWPHQPGCGGRV